MISKIAWKNVWREKKRSLIVMAAVTIGTTAGMFTTGLVQGWIRDKVNSDIDIKLSHLQIHSPKYLNNEELGNTVVNSSEILDYLDAHNLVKSSCGRIKVMSMAATSRGNTAMHLIGVDVEKEKEVSNLYKKIILSSGNYLSQEGQMQVIISDKTAEQLRIKTYSLSAEVLDSLQQAGIDSSIIHKLYPIQEERFYKEDQMQKAIAKQLSIEEADIYGKQLMDASAQYRLRAKVVFTFTDKDEKIVSQAFRVQGIYKTTDARFDLMNAFAFGKDLADVLSINPNEYHEIAMMLHNLEDCQKVQKELNQRFPANSTMNWKDISPDVALYGDYMDVVLFIVMCFIFFALAFGIINTMLMAILERTRELGMLQAIGMNKRRIFSMIMLETLYLTSVGSVIGMIIGGGLIAITGQSGIHLSSYSEGLEALGWSASFYPYIEPSAFMMTCFIVIMVSLISAIFPARRALKLNPLEAIRKI